MSNTWGDRSKDGKISEKFILDELEIAHRMDIDYFQIDDGWQAGATENSVVGGGIWEDYYNVNSGFWDVNKERFPNGLKPVADAARRNGIKLGLWFSPDSSNDFSNWEKDGNTLINLHHKYGINSFKIDAVNIRSKKGEENLFNMQQKVLQETEKKVFFNLDVTAQIRSGYFGRIQYASLFLENRYTDWVNYYPHWTLRNLWMLSKYYPTYRFQVEFLNVKRHRNLYCEDPLSPENCGIEYTFATTMFANPLAWMELSGLDDETLILLESLIKTYKEYQSDILSGFIYPIGEEPSGFSFTGFQSVTGENTGYLLILKERNHNCCHSYLLKDIKNKKLQLKKILGYGCSRVEDVDENGEVVFELAGYFQYSLFQYTVL